eukprot:TRINITY_DN27355_c0_g1_i2.p1 TRINITY_DN27355_c0_g1~~TRINITY_DN27355_c0_g1_i2.p1  ORF type:complete len:707 (+),score=113.38 TRINITY_DN27355_c0_g1_i2:62-2182(+)
MPKRGAQPCTGAAAAAAAPAPPGYEGWPEGVEHGARRVAELFSDARCGLQAGEPSDVPAGVAALLAEVRVRLAPAAPGQLLRPLASHLLPPPSGAPSGAPQPAALGTGLCFATTLRWCPAVFGPGGDGDDGLTRCLLVQGHRAPPDHHAVLKPISEVGPQVTPGPAVEFTREEPAAHRAECAALSRIAQLWQVPMPPEPSAGREGRRDRQPSPPVLVSLEFPPLSPAASPSVVTDVRWLEGADELEFAQREIREWTPASRGRAGIVCAVSSPAQVAVFAVPLPAGLKPAPAVTPLRPSAAAADPGKGGYTVCAWSLRWGEASVFAGTASGDVVWWALVADPGNEDALAFHLLTRLRGHSGGVVTALQVLPMWAAVRASAGACDAEAGGRVSAADEPLLASSWPDRPAARRRPPGVPQGASIRDLLLSAAWGDRKLRVWDLSLAAHGVQGGAMAPFCFEPSANGGARAWVPQVRANTVAELCAVPYGGVIAAVADGSLRVVVPHSPQEPLSYVPAPILLKPPLTTQSSLACLSHTTCDRASRPAAAAESAAAESLALSVTVNGVAGVLRWEQRALGHRRPAQRKCPRRGAFTTAWQSQACACPCSTPPHETAAEEVALLLCRHVSWSLPPAAPAGVAPPAVAPQVGFELRLAPSPAEVRDWGERTRTPHALLTTGDHYACDLAGGGASGAHLAAVALPGGLVVVLAV